MSIITRFIAVAGLALFGLSQQASANPLTVLYTQPYDGGSNLLASQNDTTGGLGNFATVYDNFTLGSNATISQIDWTGGYFNPPSQGTITAFTVQIYADSAGTPGASLYTDNIGGTANETLLSSVIYTYSASANFAASAGIQYWLSIVPDLGFPPQWGWATGTGGDGLAYQNFFGTTSPLSSTDFAFTLSGTATATPLPSTWLMLLSGFVGLGFFAYRGTKKTSAALAAA